MAQLETKIKVTITEKDNLASQYKLALKTGVSTLKNETSNLSHDQLISGNFEILIYVEVNLFSTMKNETMHK
jgi:hypothetical protein